MNAHSLSENRGGNDITFPPVEFGRSAEDFPVARVGDTAFAMLPGRDGKHFLASGWRIGRPLNEWRRSDFYGHSGELADEAAFRARIAENAEHQCEKKALGRREIHSRARTPWGTSQGASVYAEGVECHSTASHGGFKLSAPRNRKVHPLLRSPGGWYEEDGAWAIVAITFPQLFTSFERRCAERSIKDWWPDAWEAIFSTILDPGESHTKDQRAFEAAHADDWIVISALASDRHKGFVECVAMSGGRRGPGVEERRFLVPSDEYEAGRFGFVIDPDRHAVFDRPLELCRPQSDDSVVTSESDR
ncbi:DUF7007 domain-containing protein [Methylovirgula sp. 4M-Z18]|uniref:DUF7007 domain-containing protein n=1 Tax=Methylovirgula sp. 4M-Z18 TaxID=2293567 RepID=UPI000E2FC724|nr:hypothetical protein [Methylovirgula sp. 4M-Z18]RFB76639.1 hypothetical protein DYH55_19440 [Methylovirgula sp. 4M-Z18]